MFFQIRTIGPQKVTGSVAYILIPLNNAVSSRFPFKKIVFVEIE